MTACCSKPLNEGLMHLHPQQWRLMTARWHGKGTKVHLGLDAVHLYMQNSRVVHLSMEPCGWPGGWPTSAKQPTSRLASSSFMWTVLGKLLLGLAAVGCLACFVRTQQAA